MLQQHIFFFIFKEAYKYCIYVIQWETRSLRNKYSLHPTFSHGNTLGLYEVLVGKPYLCDMITESVVHCFFFDSDKILSLVRPDPAIEGFMWQVNFHFPNRSLIMFLCSFYRLIEKLRAGHRILAQK